MIFNFIAPAYKVEKNAVAFRIKDVDGITWDVLTPK